MIENVTSLRTIKPCNDVVIDTIREYLAKAEAGEIIGILIVADTRSEGYIATRANLRYETALAMHYRAAHRLQIEWDAVK